MSEVTALDAAEWEAWLDAHHETATEVWLVYWKKGSGKPSVAWADAVEVALKFGWIDGLIQTIDEQRYKQRWTPRRPKSKWSLVNKNIALRRSSPARCDRRAWRRSKRRRRAASGSAPTPCNRARRHPMTSRSV